MPPPKQFAITEKFFLNNSSELRMASQELGCIIHQLKALAKTIAFHCLSTIQGSGTSERINYREEASSVIGIRR
jgi:hypothetical protein